MTETKRFAIITGASTGIGLELARICAEEGHDLLLVANETEVESVAGTLRTDGAEVDTLIADLGSSDGVTRLLDTVRDRHVDYFFANAGVGLGDAFLDQDLDDIHKVIALNVTGTTELLHGMGRKLRRQGTGRILVTGSIAGFMPGSFHAVYNATKAYLDSLSYAMRNELKESDVTVTCLMPGPTETEFFDRADMEDTPVGKDDDKDDPAMVARKGYDAMMKGQSGVVTGFMNKVQATFSGLLPDTVLSQMHRRMAEPEEG
ncbi:short chain oxidoreductase [Pseudooceanicola batsensis HTCC2597]|uniref:Short chain oxidoreductase n=1 Tax=Pseudooceanicola batsensis (strain ATCC BAA-863 / DSM 15984 / KCTC 12145 / HTCC2597) TaxID=252305 RepID=A3U0F7_PSEBH|nr:SDR family NAD(P)-dependent oxidoreductase [Pseudooceanicola batsensis]EAQ02248.1 short chain oxidoreductase [Pseudooceanicola batsensis HTCC2597]